LNGAVKILFASCGQSLLPRAVEKASEIFPELPLYVVSEFAPPSGNWIRYHVKRRFSENSALCRAQLNGKSVRLSAVVLQPGAPYRRMQILAFLQAPHRFLMFNENLDHFMLSPRSLPAIVRHVAWRMRDFVQRQTHPGGRLYTWLWRMRHPRELRRPLFYRLALIAGGFIGLVKRLGWGERVRVADSPIADGISVVIPSRDGRELLERLLPSVAGADEIIIVDNGSTNVSEEFPGCTVIRSQQPLSFARAANLGVSHARFSHTCLLNNDMVLKPGFLAELRRAFDSIPDLFCATAQISFPEGRRREETGKAVLASGRVPPTDSPLRCDEPLAGEDHSWVLYGSGGCSLYDTAKLRAIGGFDESYHPAYCEDLDIGVRAWQQGWPSVYCAGAQCIHYHRATTSRYFAADEIHSMQERHYLWFLVRTVATPAIFLRLWRDAVVRLNLLRNWRLLAGACSMSFRARPGIRRNEQDLFALGSGLVWCFPGRPASGRTRVLIATPYLPYPLAHGAAVRIYNLMRRAAADTDLILVSFVEEALTPPRELLDICTEIVTVLRPGTHALPSTPRPDTVEEFDHPAFHAALHMAVRKWQPDIAQLEFTQMAQYAEDCRPARTILVEHDVTYDLYAQLLAQSRDWEIEREHARWVAFETEAWRSVDHVVTMSEKDRALIPGSSCLPNGVDLDRFRPDDHEPVSNELLFIGAFQHHPNVLAIQWFLSQVWPLLEDLRVHVIAGRNHQRFYDLQHPAVDLEGFVEDVRPAYRRASVVIAPLLASAGTNIKILEAMAMGKAIVSTRAGIHGLEVAEAVTIADDPQSFARAIQELVHNPDRRRALGIAARDLVASRYDWDRIAEEQRRLYNGFLAVTEKSRPPKNIWRNDSGNSSNPETGADRSTSIFVNPASSR
jgi:GT2 family glycosyltransferase/glycosyltransferase involved in cell wall biosynthesis